MSLFFFFIPRPSKGYDLVYFSSTKKLYHSTITASLLRLMVSTRCWVVHFFKKYKVVSCGLRCGGRRAGERSSTAGSRGPGKETPHRRTVNCAGCFPGAVVAKPHTDACRDRIVQAIKADPAERDKYCRRKTLERRAGGGASQAQCRRGAQCQQLQPPAQRLRSSRQAARSRVRLRWRWMSTRERLPPRFLRSIGRVWPRRCARLATRR